MGYIIYKLENFLENKKLKWWKKIWDMLIRFNRYKIFRKRELGGWIKKKKIKGRSENGVCV